MPCLRVRWVQRSHQNAEQLISRCGFWSQNFFASFARNHIIFAPPPFSKILATPLHWSVDLAVPQQLHWSDTDTTETHWSVNLAAHVRTAVTLVRYRHNRDTLVCRLSCSTAVTLVRYGHYRDTLVSRLSCTTAVTLVRYEHYRDTLVSLLSCTYRSYTGQIRTLHRHTDQST